MQSLGKVFRRTRTTMIESESDANSKELETLFGLREGDYFEFDQDIPRRKYPLRRTARVLSVERVWFNQAGGYTATFLAAPLLQGGGLGTSKRIYLVRDKKGASITRMACGGCEHFRKVEI